MAQIVLVPGRQSLVDDAHLQGAVLPQQVVGDAFEDGHVVGGVARADAAVVLAKGDIHDPVVGIFDTPVPAHRLQLEPGLGGAGWRLRLGSRPLGPDFRGAMGRSSSASSGESPSAKSGSGGGFGR